MYPIALPGSYRILRMSLAPRSPDAATIDHRESSCRLLERRVVVELVGLELDVDLGLVGAEVAASTPVEGYHRYPRQTREGTVNGARVSTGSGQPQFGMRPPSPWPFSVETAVQAGVVAIEQRRGDGRPLPDDPSVDGGEPRPLSSMEVLKPSADRTSFRPSLAGASAEGRPASWCHRSKPS